MTMNFVELPPPVIGVKNQDGTQNVSIYCKDGFYRTVISTPEKIDEFVSAKNKAKKKEIASTIGLTGGLAAVGTIVGAIIQRKLPGAILDKVLGGIVGAFVGALTGLLVPKNKNVEKVYSILTDGVPQTPVQSENKGSDVVAGSNSTNLLKPHIK